MTTRNLQCCVCGASAGRFQQHWNRDTGFGICGRCAAAETRTLAPDEMMSYYGKEGVNYVRAP